MNLFTIIATIIRTRQISLPLFGRQFLIRFDPQLQVDPVEHVLWNILGFNLSGGIDRYSAQVEGFVAVLGVTVNLDLAFSDIGTGGVNLIIETPLTTLHMTVGFYLTEPEQLPVMGHLLNDCPHGADGRDCEEDCSCVPCHGSPARSS